MKNWRCPIQRSWVMFQHRARTAVKCLKGSLVGVNMHVDMVRSIQGKGGWDVMGKVL